MRKAAFLTILAALALAGTASAGTGTALKGIVIARLPHQGELVIAAPNGRTTTLRAPVLPAAGTVIATGAFGLSDGTSATSHLSVVGHTRHANFNGILVRTVGGVVLRRRTALSPRIRPRGRSPRQGPIRRCSRGRSAEVEVTITAGGILDEDSITRERRMTRTRRASR